MATVSSPLQTADDGLSVDTQDALNVIARIDFILASLEKAGVPAGEIQQFKSVVSRISLAQEVNAQSETIANTGVEAVAEGVLHKLQQGTQGFAPVWKPRWIRISPGEMQVYESASRPELGVPCLFRLPLSVQQTRVETGNEAMCKRLGREAIIMVSSTTSVGGTMRCVTLAVQDDLALEKWTAFVEKAMSTDGYVADASIYSASQTGDILRVKHLVSRGFPVNHPNTYGCLALHYAVKNAAECAKAVARGGDGPGAPESKMRAQEALRVVVFLMSHGGDARATNNLGETPLDMGSRLTAGFPKSRQLLLSILDSSKYQNTGGAIFIVPGEPKLASICEENFDEETPDQMLHPRSKCVRARGVTFSPSRRNHRLRKQDDIERSRLPCGSAAMAASRGRNRTRSVQRLPFGDHETAIGGARHRLAATLDFRRNHAQKIHRYGHTGSSSPVASGDARYGQAVGFIFKDFRMGRSSAILSPKSKHEKPRAYLSARPSSCPTSEHRRNAHLKISSARRPSTVHRVRENGGDAPTPHGRRNDTRQGLGSEQNTLTSRRGRAREHKVASGKANGPSVSDSEARRQISEWLRESACTVSAVPPATAHNSGGCLVETSGFVATSRQSDVYKALQAIKGDGRGELISSTKLRAILCRVGQPLSPHEMDDLLREADPGDTGYVSCSRLSKLVAGGRLAPLAAGTLYNEEDDVVLKTKARRLARLARLERAAVVSSQSHGAQA